MMRLLISILSLLIAVPVFSQYSASQGIDDSAPLDFKLGEVVAWGSRANSINVERFLFFENDSTGLVLETQDAGGHFDGLSIFNNSGSAGLAGASITVKASTNVDTSYIKLETGLTNGKSSLVSINDDLEFVSGGGNYFFRSSIVDVTTVPEKVLTVDGEQLKQVNVNQIGVPTAGYSPAQGGTISVDFNSNARFIAEVNCASVTSAFTMNTQEEFSGLTVMGSAGYAAVYNVRFYNVGGSAVTVTLDVGLTWHDEKGNTITDITLAASEDKILTFYTSDGSNMYTME